MVLANLSHAERLDHDALLDGLSKVTTQKGLIYHQKRETSEKCPNILLERAIRTGTFVTKKGHFCNAIGNFCNQGGELL